MSTTMMLVLYINQPWLFLIIAIVFISIIDVSIFMYNFLTILRIR